MRIFEQEIMKLANVNEFSYKNKYIYIYEDHRTILNVLACCYEANHNPINIVYFDAHDDAGSLKKYPKPITATDCLKKIDLDELRYGRVSNLRAKISIFTEFYAGFDDGDWIVNAMDLNLIKNALLIGQKKINQSNIDICSVEKLNNKSNYICSIGDLLNTQGGLNDCIINEENDLYEYVHNIINSDEKFILDIDLDCFTDEGGDFALTEYEFICKYNHQSIKHLIDKAFIITICKESKYCGGMKEAYKILGYLDKYWFKGALDIS